MSVNLQMSWRRQRSDIPYDTACTTGLRVGLGGLGVLNGCTVGALSSLLFTFGLAALSVRFACLEVLGYVREGQRHRKGEGEDVSDADKQPALGP